MKFEFNVQLERANCHIRATRTHPLPNETICDRPHKHYSVEFHCILSGQEIVTLPHENKKIVLSAGQILLLPQGSYHGVSTDEIPVERLCFNFSAEPIGKESSPIVDLFVNINQPVLFDNHVTASFIDQCRLLCTQSQAPLLELRQGMHFINMALNLMSSVRDVPTEAHPESPLALRQKWTIEDYITKHYILDIRIRKAKQCLVDTPFTIASISEECGFSSVYYFCHLFKQRTGKTPSQYAAENKNGQI